MQHKDPTLRITDMPGAIAKIERYVAGMTFESFLSDERTVDAVIRNVGIIGEAANHVPIEIQQRYPHVAWSQMRGIRNVVVHEYSGVELKFIWDAVQNDLPELRTQLHDILANE